MPRLRWKRYEYDYFLPKIFCNLVRRGRPIKQECIPVGCVPSSAVTAGGGGGFWGCLPGGCVCPGVCLPGGCIPACTEADTPSPVDRRTDRCKKHYLAATSLRTVNMSTKPEAGRNPTITPKNGVLHHFTHGHKPQWPLSKGFAESALTMTAVAKWGWRESHYVHHCKKWHEVKDPVSQILWLTNS